ncbi:hypothetical protein XELAEV_18004467mg [Xenopus laevis]|uniref:Receptor ligand binding region domain-containing protein n=1 Tax=Xenopus laevis TaxID=8355 RepID=A0A974BRJ5_XENLA|nr:hypothetical protein XELAEV_18004467mg [Xenopus laevis]
MCVRPCRSEIFNPACHLEIIKTVEEYEYIQEGDIIIGGLVTVSMPYESDYFSGLMCIHCSFTPPVLVDRHQEFEVQESQIQYLYIGKALITYGATDPALSDRFTFPYLFQPIKEDDRHYFIISKIVNYFGWNWVGIIVFDDDDRGDKDQQLLKYYLNRANICIEFTLKITSNKYLLYGEIIKKSSANVIIVCGPVNVKLAGKINNLSYMLSEKTFIFTPNWLYYDDILDLSHEIFDGSLILLQSQSEQHLNPAFKQFLTRLHPKKYSNDKLIENIWMNHCKCLSNNHKKNQFYESVLKQSLHNCSGQENLETIFSFVFHSLNMFSATHSLMIGLNNMLNSPTSGMNRNFDSYRYKRHSISPPWHMATIHLAALDFSSLAISYRRQGGEIERRLMDRRHVAFSEEDRKRSIEPSYAPICTCANGSQFFRLPPICTCASIRQNINHIVTPKMYLCQRQPKKSIILPHICTCASRSQKSQTSVYLSRQPPYCPVYLSQQQPIPHIAHPDHILRSRSLQNDFWTLIEIFKFPILKGTSQRLNSCFGSTYLCESGFSDMKILKSKYRTHLNDDHLGECMRLAVSNFTPDIQKLAENMQCQISY